jgi:hypothetical protein
MLIVLVGILPLHNFVGHAHWQYIRWVPTPDQLSSPAILLDLGIDAVANILLFLPFGLLYTLRGLGGKSFSPGHLDAHGLRTAPSASSTTRSIVTTAARRCSTCWTMFSARISG